MAVSGTGLYACQLAKHVFNAGKGDHHRLDIESCQGGRTVRRGNRRSEQVSRDTDRDVTSTGHKSTVDDEYVSEQETFTAEAEPRGGRQRAEQPSARHTTVIDRPETAPENWQRWVRGRRGSQQLVPIGDITDVGKTVNRAVGTIHDVGSKAISSAGNTAGRALGDVVEVSQGEQKGKEEQLRLRLDLNLDIEVQLKATIHGDLTLQLL
ncbi:hypothetical protein IFM51744_06837 [Aspergillus udagawae]|nr:hypothetical protein IFM51744_06837 [Aspergillus udagawae]